jgi:class 3 adenylate cyclase
MSECGIVIADLVGSSRLYEELGDVDAKARVEACISAMTRAVADVRGRVVKHLGDGIIARVSTQEDAIRAATGICDRVEELGSQVRVGAHWGAVIDEGSDLFGAAVNATARIVALAKAGEILFDRSLDGAADRVLHGEFHRVGPIAVKGLREPLELRSVFRSSACPDESAQRTETIGTVLKTAASSFRILTLRYQQAVVRISDAREVTLGRDRRCDLVVEQTFTSRVHARVAERQGKFHLVDQSANGTWVVANDRELVLLRETAILAGAGRIFLGASPSVSRCEPVHYETT